MVMGTSWYYGERDYRAIEEALMRSGYGSWFLSEYLARNRSRETLRLLEALDRLQSSLESGAGGDQVPRLREIAEEIDAALEAALVRMTPASTTERASEPPVESILEAVEDINSFVAALSARRVHQRLPEKIRARLADIQRCCAQVDKTSEAAQTLTAVLADLRQRLTSVGVRLDAAGQSAASMPSADKRIPPKLLDELAAALCPYAEAPAGG